MPPTAAAGASDKSVARAFGVRLCPFYVKNAASNKHQPIMQTRLCPEPGRRSCWSFVGQLRRAQSHGRRTTPNVKLMAAQKKDERKATTDTRRTQIVAQKDLQKLKANKTRWKQQMCTKKTTTKKRIQQTNKKNWKCCTMGVVSSPAHTHTVSHTHTHT